MTNSSYNNKKPLIILTGPTAVGKTDLSINLARKLNAEIISADSAQVYKGMDIGSAKITKEEMQGVRHHLIDIIEPDEEFDVTIFQSLAKKALDDIYSRGHIPIIVGGTGFYIQALLYDINFNIEGETSQYREELEKYVEETGDIDKLYNELKQVDPVSAEKIHKNNIRKVIRALEYFHFHNEPISLHNEQERSRESAYNSLYFVLNMDRSVLYERINKRVDIMKDSGLLEEVKSLTAKGYGSELTSMQAIGYKEIISYLNGEYSLDEAFEQIKLNTRHFAKRQLTWFRREKDVIWVNKDGRTEEDILEEILEKIKEKINV